MLCLKSVKFSEWMLFKDIHKLSKTIYKVSKNSLPETSEKMANEIATEILWNQPEKVLDALKNIK